MGVKVLGLTQTLSNMRELSELLGPKSRASPLLPALRAAGKIVQTEAKQIVRKKSGALADNIIVARLKKRRLKGATEAVEVTVRYKSRAYKDNARNRKAGRVGEQYQDRPLFYGTYLEYGTSKMPAYPFMRPAFDATAPFLPDVISNVLSASIAKHIAKLRTKV